MNFNILTIIGLGIIFYAFICKAGGGDEDSGNGSWLLVLIIGLGIIFMDKV